MITIIGAGPAGSYSAYLIAKKGLDVRVIEEHSEIGSPVACTGIITEAANFKVPEEIIVSKPPKARIFAPNNSYVDVNLRNDIVLDREKLDKHLAKLAEQSGAKYFLNKRFVDCEKERDRWKVKLYDNNSGETRTIITDVLIGADGPLSRVAKTAGIYGDRKLYAGIQVTAEIENEGFIEFYPRGKNIAWIVPENKQRARIGIAADEKPDVFFKSFIEEKLGSDWRQKIIAKQSGLIPLYDPKIKTEQDNIYLVGDAATTAKATTLGGINQSLIGASCIAEAVLSGKSYERLWKKKMGRDLYLSLLMRKTMNKFSDEDYNNLVRIFGKEKNKSLLEKYDRDKPSRFALKLAVQEPSLWRFARYLF